MKVLNFGSLNIDYVYKVDHMVTRGETLISETRETYPGGKGLNQSIALGRAGVMAFHAGNIGSEGTFLLDVLKEASVNVEQIHTHENISTGHAIIQNDKDGDNCILLFGGANQAVTKSQVTEVLEEFEAGDYLVLQNEINELSYIIEQAYSIGMHIVLNPAPMNEQILQANLNHVEYLILNEVECGQLTGISPLKVEEMLERMKQQYPDTKIVLTLGSKGSVYLDSKQIFHQRSYSVQAIDTTAAGDTFTGYFIAGIMTGKTVADSMEQAAKAAAIAVTRNGAAPSIPFMAEVEEFTCPQSP